ncbi:hypothetical protein [Amycolatopsis sp. NPDC051071]|uniref:hypothetical protein n=1 Tax=Amycolatopsis sp. NPDC051071 TaxID=3154637 RepID=UPI0034383156
MPTGAFYLFPDISRFLGGDGPATSDEFCTLLLERMRAGIVPGSVFDSSGTVRISYAAAPSVVAEGLELLQKFVSG